MIKKNEEARIREIVVDVKRLESEINTMGVNKHSSKDDKDLALEKSIEMVTLLEELNRKKKLSFQQRAKLKAVKKALQLRNNKKFKKIYASKIEEQTKQLEKTK